MRRTAPVITAFVTGVVVTISFFFNEQTTFIGQIQSGILIWVTIIFGMSLALGMVSITRVNFNKVKRRQEGWPYSLLVIISVFVMAIPSALPVSWSPLFGRNEGSIYYWLWTRISEPMMATMFAMLAFYIASAAYRAFRARSTESTLLLLTAVVVMLSRIPMGEWFLRLFHPSLPDWINIYIMNGFNLSVQRGIIIGAALGAASMSLRIILGIERTYMGKG
ncbi:MAG: hypothetical protein RBT76_15390 [candidate division Zixibacteria bacterium]|jgi:hypothetical protein|nr:hypothetical protein [candidate division Zixibacteria bacterium]